MVGKGDRVAPGQMIARSNETGSGITGPHLHYDHKDSEGYVDPQEELDECS